MINKKTKRSKEEIYANKPKPMQKLSDIQNALRSMDVKYATTSNIIGFLIENAKDSYTVPAHTEKDKNGVEVDVAESLNYKQLLYHIQDYIISNTNLEKTKENMEEIVLEL